MMKRFAELYAALDASNKTSDKVAAMASYFAAAPAEDAAWAVYFLIGRRPRQVVSTRNLRAWVMAAANVPEWLLDESYEAVGDLAETVALLLPDASAGSSMALSRWVERLLQLPGLAEAEQAAVMQAAWAELGTIERLVWNKLITGAFRVGVAQSLVVRALAEVGKLPTAVVAHRLMGAWEPTGAWFRGLLTGDAGEADASRPYPFLLAHPLDEPDTLGEPSLWQAEWKWDGIRAQVIRRAGQVYVWSRGEELITERFPEVAMAAAKLPDGTVLDGEILPWKDGAVLPFALLQRRIGRKQLTRKILEEVPAVLMAFDMLEHGGEDKRERPLGERRVLLERVIAGVDPAIRPSPVVTAPTWAALAQLREDSRAQQVEGLMLKRRGSVYGVGRPRGDWWKWKIRPHTMIAGLLADQHETGVLRALAEHGAGGAGGEVAGAAGGGGVAQDGELARGGDERGGRGGRRGEHGGGARGCLAHELGDRGGLGQAGPVLARHLGAHGPEVEAGGVEGAAVVGEEQVAHVVADGGGGARGAWPEVQVREIPGGGCIGGEDRPAHVGEPAREERGGQRDDAVVGAVPGDEVLVAGVYDPAEPDERVHLVLVAADGGDAGAQSGDVGVDGAGEQVGLAVGQAVEQAVEQRPAGGVAVVRGELGEREELGRDARGRAG